MTLYVVRHGRTEANATGKLLGRADPDLDELGRRQAADLAAVLPADARVVSSPLRRCVQTAETLGRPVEVDPRLVELDYGEFDLIPLSEVPADVWRRWRSDETFRPPGGETLVELADRVGACLDDLSGDAAGGNVVAVTHVSPVKAAMAWALGVGIGVSWRSFVATASITTIGVSDRGVSLQGFNAVGHLR
ncbi:MAG: histidine phosphatase family protein [Acidimicrobiales bacterium]